MQESLRQAAQRLSHGYDGLLMMGCRMQGMRCRQRGMPAQVVFDQRGEPAERPVGLVLPRSLHREGCLRRIQFTTDVVYPGLGRPSIRLQKARSAGLPANGRSVKTSIASMQTGQT